MRPPFSCCLEPENALGPESADVLSRHTHRCIQVKVVVYTCTLTCTNHLWMPVCFMYIHSCICPHEHTHMRIHTHTRSVLKQKSKQHPCYFCFFRINLMDRMSADIMTDWLNQDTKCTTERGHSTLHYPGHTHTNRFLKPVTVTGLLHAGTLAHCYASQQSG